MTLSREEVEGELQDAIVSFMKSILDDGAGMSAEQRSAYTIGRCAEIIASVTTSFTTTFFQTKDGEHQEFLEDIVIPLMKSEEFLAGSTTSTYEHKIGGDIEDSNTEPAII